MVGTIIVALLGLGGTMLVSPNVDMRIEPLQGTELVGETFTVDVVVTSDEPVNVFKGEVRFDPEMLSIEQIDYNTSIADLWAERPWYQNGAGTLNFIGGSTHRGGFFGTGSLITITFRTKKLGETALAIEDVRILKHDGLGSDATVAQPIDAVFTIAEATLEEQTVLKKSIVGSTVTVVAERPQTDLNQDGKQSLADISIFMKDLATQNERSDFNKDGVVNTADLSIILNAD